MTAISQTGGTKKNGFATGAAVLQQRAAVSIKDMLNEKLRSMGHELIGGDKE